MRRLIVSFETLWMEQPSSDAYLQAARRACGGLVDAVSSVTRPHDLASQEVQKVLTAMPTVMITGALEY
jgi:hypothetical protein